MKYIDWEEITNDDLEEEFEDSDDNPQTNGAQEEEEKPFDADRIRVDYKPISIKQMVEMIDSEQLNLNPGFQRRKVWTDKKRKSLLIESLMLRIPLPVFYVYEDQFSVWHVVDGLQRMNTIYEFIYDEFSLTGLEYLKHSNGKKFGRPGLNKYNYDIIDHKYKNRITTTTLYVNVIDSLTPVQVKYDIFRRINTGGMPLNAQEIRNSTIQENTRKYLSSLVTSDEFKVATNNMSDLRMQAQELVLRFIAFFEAYNPETGEVKYKKGMDTFLDQACDNIDNARVQKLKYYRRKFLNAMKTAYLLFGDDAFRRVSIRDNKRKPINKSLFTCMSVILADYDYDKLSNHDWRDIAKKRLATEIDKNNVFNESLSKGTGDPSRIKVQFSVMKKIIEGLMTND
ncbi:DUF262 domain-containing protein [Desulforamulus aquiferis]|uniref:DUF262 domain-containing protein n=1 Tax=Desulforamulus aquiferis TaxID=1397668 RepID=A0AAW7ZF43_9FIRM|nr:DUF262 domain-containing protein [Desulforamulus aquiferis]MDO7787867.1 DUF262 domain-containing protein [Desulforamulus aquiferis]